MPEAIVALGTGKRVVGRLRFESYGRRQHSHFVYSDEWLAARDRFALSPGLPLSEGGHYSSGRHNIRMALSGCFADAAPDSWGRALMTRVLGGGLSEFEFLVHSDDLTRQGALRFFGQDMEPLSRFAPTIPRLVELNRLRELARRFEQDPGGADAEVRELAGLAGSLGGARPKANIRDKDQLWLAKFTSERDTRPIERVEVATMQLAGSCGLRASHARLELSDSDRPVALIRRFDRRESLRIPYMSARTALDWQSDDGGYYTDIAEVIRRICTDPVEDLHELWKRVVFTILVSNSDDHLQNHGFIYAGGNRWRLSPAFDINPSPSRHRVLETGIVQGETFVASIDLALEACAFFDLDRETARRHVVKMARYIADNWQVALRQQGTSADEIRGYSEAFEHDEVERALGLDG